MPLYKLCVDKTVNNQCMIRDQKSGLHFSDVRDRFSNLPINNTVLECSSIKSIKLRA